MKCLFLSIKAKASFIATYEESAPIILETFPVLKTSLNGYKNCLLVEIEGNSMSPTLLHGTKILCSKIESTEWSLVSGLFAILYRDFFVVKRVRNNDLTVLNTLTLHSDNKEFGSAIIEGKDIKEIWRAVKIYEQSLE